jgi:hypothetical protein
MQKHPALRACEFAANFRLAETGVVKGKFGLCLTNGEGEVLRYAVDCETSIIRINGDAVYALSSGPILRDYHQLRMIRGQIRSLFYFDDALVADIATTPGLVTCSIFGENVQLAVEMIRLTAI